MDDEAPLVMQIREFEHLDVSPDRVLQNGRVDIYPDLRSKGYVDVRVGTAGTRIQAKGFIGLIPVNDKLTLEVRPRVPLASLSHLLQISGASPQALMWAIRAYERTGTMYPSLAVVYATGLRSSIEHIAARGMLKEYERIDDVTSYPKGRIQIARTINSTLARGVTHKAAVTFFSRSMDNAANRCLVYAIWQLSQYVSLLDLELSAAHRRSVHQDLNRAWHLLRGVNLDRAAQFLTDGLVTGRRSLPALRSYYAPALELAYTIIRREGVAVEQTGSTVRLPSLVVDMSDVFESYLRTVLARAARERGWPVDVVDGRPVPPVGGRGSLFNPGVVVATTPDIVLRRSGSSGVMYPLLVEVKYKPAGAVPAREDLNQAITYGVAYGAPRVVLAQPRSEGSPVDSGVRFLGGLAGMELYQYVIDLASDPLEQERAFVDALGELAFGTTPTS